MDGFSGRSDLVGNVEPALDVQAVGAVLIRVGQVGGVEAQNLVDASRLFLIKTKKKHNPQSADSGRHTSSKQNEQKKKKGEKNVNYDETHYLVDFEKLLGLFDHGRAEAELQFLFGEGVQFQAVLHVHVVAQTHKVVRGILDWNRRTNRSVHGKLMELLVAIYERN